MTSSGRIPRLCVPDALVPQASVVLTEKQSHYLMHVMRLGEGDTVLLFNGRDGEWCACLERIERHHAHLMVSEQTRPQSVPPNVHYFFAPVRGERLDYIAQKAVEMGVRTLCPVLTQHTQVRHLNLHKIQANMIEAAEQCGIITLPEVAAPEKLSQALTAFRKHDGILVFCDEEAPTHSPLEALKIFSTRDHSDRPIAILVGPEGGFDAAERALLNAFPKSVRLWLGPRILRADTAGVAALALVQSILGDWR